MAGMDGIEAMKPLTSKPRMIAVVAADEIASIERRGEGDIVGGKVGSGYWGYEWSIKRWRERRERLAQSESRNNKEGHQK